MWERQLRAGMSPALPGVFGQQNHLFLLTRNRIAPVSILFCGDFPSCQRLRVIATDCFT